MDLRLPDLGTATLVSWLKQPGESFMGGEPVYEVQIGEAATKVTARSAGVLREQLLAVGANVSSGQAVGTADPDRRLITSPLVRTLVRRHGIHLADVSGTGDGGRVRREDIEVHLGDHGAIPKPREMNDPPVREPDPIEKFTRIRRITAERMLRSTQNAAQVMTSIEVDYDSVARTRAEHGEAFAAREGYSLTYLPFIVSATARALIDFPRVNASVLDDAIQLHQHIDIGIAVALGFDGLIVPVVRDADQLSLTEVARAIRTLSDQARNRKLSPQQMIGGSFTVTNPGGYGTFVGAAIINPPQVAILNVDGISKQPVVVERAGEADLIAIRCIGHLSMSWDHRAIDGLYAAAFLDRLRTELQDGAWEV